MPLVGLTSGLRHKSFGALGKIVVGKGCLNSIVGIVQVHLQDIEIQRIIGEAVALVKHTGTNLFADKHIGRILCFTDNKCFLGISRQENSDKC